MRIKQSFLMVKLFEPEFGFKSPEVDTPPFLMAYSACRQSFVGMCLFGKYF